MDQPTKKKFTKQQVRNWRLYEAVRVSGFFNMYDPRAHEATTLTKEDYLFVIEHYAELKAKARGSIQ